MTVFVHVLPCKNKHADRMTIFFKNKVLNEHLHLKLHQLENCPGQRELDKSNFKTFLKVTNIIRLASGELLVD